ncbi:MAG: 50S ribosomal protein L4 [Candidatus Doudnabacteria bacterium RIFCSPHIGHO2_02_FULL_46_11]|uniref:Large ribosomal subunit protein uL4 n=1 Tax=Candidatus Doudnabacteria bacterium RIFCSPHIGHO2_02_FULL_46_11 TaxID=1817832 RepID=A0A1F5P5C9_9BACT|nr:ribosomal protein L4 [uncultured bacterium]OGE85113.1 MAG: 50S ribosomal protein L4 [Candidatus Doudnabacteria bacterium RIFCSPHIGHO2_02_FULL_46_11]
MAKVNVYNQAGDKVEELELNSGLFDVNPNLALLEEAVRMQLANKRETISKTLTRAEVRGGGRKPWKQKGTGRARHGSIRSPLWSGGGVTFGPTSARNWSLKMNKSAYRKALFMALTDKVRSNSLIVVDKLEITEPKTNLLAKTLNGLLAKLEASDRGSLLVIGNKNENVERAGRNIAKSHVIRANSLNVYDILKSNNLVVTKDAIPVIEKTFSKPGKDT